MIADAADPTDVTDLMTPLALGPSYEVESKAQQNERGRRDQGDGI